MFTIVYLLCIMAACGWTSLFEVVSSKKAVVSTILAGYFKYFKQLNLLNIMNSHFVGAVIYADDITLLGPTRNSVMVLLDICSNYAHDHDINFNPSKTTCIHFPCHQSIFPGK